MSRTIPRAYVTAAWSKKRNEAEEEARLQERELGEELRVGLSMSGE